MNNSFTKVFSRSFDGTIIEKYKLNEELSVDLISSVFRYFNVSNSLYAITCEFDGEDFNGFSQSSTCQAYRVPLLSTPNSSLCYSWLSALHP